MEIDFAFGVSLNVLVASVIISSFELMDFVRHHLKHNTNSQENNTEYAKSKHGAHCCGNRSPSWQSLLLEF